MDTVMVCIEEVDEEELEKREKEEEEEEDFEERFSASECWSNKMFQNSQKQLLPNESLYLWKTFYFLE